MTRTCWQEMLINCNSSQVKPQGSVLGPLLFLLFINDIDNNIQSPLRLFADDTILYREIWSKDDHNIIQNDIQTLFKWSQTWKLDFNVTKCKVLTISNKKDPDKFNYTLNTDPLEHVDSHQYLGVITVSSDGTHTSVLSLPRRPGHLMSYAAPYTPAILK